MFKIQFDKFFIFMIYYKKYRFLIFNPFSQIKNRFTVPLKCRSKYNYPVFGYSNVLRTGCSTIYFLFFIVQKKWENWY